MGNKRRRTGRRLRRLVGRLILITFLMLNLLAYSGAYALTHFRAPGQFGLGLPRPMNTTLPSDLGLDYTTQRIAIAPDQWLETWRIPARSAPKGTVILFHGNAGSKSSQLLAPAQVFHELGYDTLLVDFRGVGGSSGSTSTLGVREAVDVSRVVQVAEPAQRPIVLYGVSLGSAAILKAIAHWQVRPDAIVLELPFARLLDAVRSRLRAIRVPTFPIAELLVFWGSLQHGFNGFVYNPVDYARQVTCPTLLLHGRLDRWTTVAEIQQIFENLRGKKHLTIFADTGHSLLVTIDRDRWRQSVEELLSGL